MHRETDCWTEKETKEKVFVISVGRVDVKEKWTEQYQESFILFRLTEIFLDEQDLREDLERRAQQAVLGENSVQRELYA